MNDAMRRAGAILLVMVGGAAPWWAGNGGRPPHRQMTPWSATIAVARERAAANDPRLKPASRFEEGGWIYVHLEGGPGRDGIISTGTAGQEIETGSRQ